MSFHALAAAVIGICALLGAIGYTSPPVNGAAVAAERVPDWAGSLSK